MWKRNELQYLQPHYKMKLEKRPKSVFFSIHSRKRNFIPEGLATRLKINGQWAMDVWTMDGYALCSWSVKYTYVAVTITVQRSKCSNAFWLHRFSLILSSSFFFWLVNQFFHSFFIFIFGLSLSLFGLFRSKRIRFGSMNVYFFARTQIKSHHQNCSFIFIFFHCLSLLKQNDRRVRYLMNYYTWIVMSRILSQIRNENIFA